MHFHVYSQKVEGLSLSKCLAIDLKSQISNTLRQKMQGNNFLCFKEPLWRTFMKRCRSMFCREDTFFWFGQRSGLRHEKHAHGFCVLTLMHLFSGSMNQHANISEAKPLKLVGACSKWEEGKTPDAGMASNLSLNL